MFDKHQEGNNRRVRRTSRKALSTSRSEWAMKCVRAASANWPSLSWHDRKRLAPHQRWKASDKDVVAEDHENEEAEDFDHLIP